MPTTSSLDTVLDVLDRSETSISEFILALLTNPSYCNHHHRHDLVQHCSDVFLAFLHHPDAHNILTGHSFNLVECILHGELTQLASGANGWHFGASRASTKQMEDFSIKEMAENIQLNAPNWWKLLGVMLDSEKKQERPNVELDVEMAGVGPTSVDTEDYWDQVDEVDLEGFISNLAEDMASSSPIKNPREKQWMANILMKKTVVSGIIVHGMNQKANMIQSILGLFMQSAHAPYSVIDALARIGITISIDTMNLAVRSLSVESQNQLRSLGRSLLASYAYDNFDVDLKTEVPTVEKSNESLKHLTSGLMFPIVHGVTVKDLKCSNELWQKSQLNSHAHNQDLPPKRTWRDLLCLHPESLPDASSLSRHDKFNSWMFLRDLCTYGPEYFHQFQSIIPEIDPIEQIPIIKTPILAARAMDVNNSTVSGNIQAINKLLEQGGIAAPSSNMVDKSPDISEYIILVHGDLGTGERIQAAQLQRSIESTPWDRLQHVLFVPGLFHLKMACADALWRCFLYPSVAREDKTSLMKDVAQLCPKETGIYASKPNFRRMHQLIGHAGICRRLC